MIPIVHLSDVALVLANGAFWVATFLLAGWIGARTPVDHLGSDGPVLRLRPFERGGRWYQRHLRIVAWKDRLPEAGTVFGGMSKRRLPPDARRHLDRFAIETRRAERVHWASLLGLPLTVIWNPPIGVLLMTAFGLAFNLPFIAIQRYNRARIGRILERRRPRQHATAGSPGLS